ncbi:MAG: LacI family DNA-binding transcriptional regulator [Spirochaetales bacterium]|jgi:LacI family transcriptional regulator|nr:LacI family DNA-binding transcriptional regulator [Spirochaetales bacterium]
MGKDGNKTTIKDIARMANVSIGTVDRVIHRRGRVKLETEERIRRIIKETGYIPDFFASQLSHNLRGTFGVIIPRPEQDSGYWSLCLEGLKNAEKDLEFYGVDVRYFFYNRYRIEHIREVIDEASASECSGFVIAPVVLDPFREAICTKRLTNAISFFDTEIPGISVISKIGQDSFRSGKLAGKLMSLVSSDSDLILIMEISENDYHLQQRVEGFLAYFEEKKNREVVKLSSSDTDSPEEVKACLKRYLADHPVPVGIFVPNSTTHLYATSCRALGLEGVRFVGYDNVPENISCLQEGLIDFLISQRPDLQGADALLNLFRATMLHQSVPERIVVPSDIITLENIPD